MYDDRDLLVTTFESNTEQVPDQFDVLTRANEIARTRRRTRWVVQATSLSLVTAGLVFGGVALPGLVGGSAGNGRHAQVFTAAAGGDHTEAAELVAFFDAGYDYNDATRLAGLWNEPNTSITLVKAEAGGKLLDGEKLPVNPSGNPVPPANQEADAAVNAFFQAGYSYNDAATLANMWNEKGTYQAKVKAGKKLEAGDSLPIPPSGSSDPAAAGRPSGASAKAAMRAKRKMILVGKGKTAPTVTTNTEEPNPRTQAEYDAYFNAGYSYTDAQQLGTLWNETDLSQVKTEAGQKLIDGETLPIPPSGAPAPPENTAVETFFNKGYDYNDAVKLASIWNTSTYHAKIEAGKKLENGESLPIDH